MRPETSAPQPSAPEGFDSSGRVNPSRMSAGTPTLPSSPAERFEASGKATPIQAETQSSEAALRQEICRVGRSLFERGYVHATAGNISALLPDGQLLITSTDACLGNLDPAQLALVNAQGRQLSGERASKTLALHRCIYGADPQAGCVIHTHSTALVALTLEGVWQADRILPPITPYFVMKVGPVPLVPYRRPGDPWVGQWVAERIATMIERGQPLRAVMLDRLGPQVWHRSPAQASAVLEELEETARLWRSCQPRPQPLSEEQVQELREVFGAVW